MPTKYSYFIVYPPGSQNRGKIQVFQQWLLEQVKPAERKSAIDAADADSLLERIGAATHLSADLLQCQTSMRRRQSLFRRGLLQRSFLRSLLDQCNHIVWS